MEEKRQRRVQSEDERGGVAGPEATEAFVPVDVFDYCFGR